MIVAFVGFSRIFLLEILIFKGLTARRIYKSFGVKGLKWWLDEGLSSSSALTTVKIPLATKIWTGVGVALHRHNLPLKELRTQVLQF
jgi:hypothetical protein